MGSGSGRLDAWGLDMQLACSTRVAAISRPAAACQVPALPLLPLPDCQIWLKAAEYKGVAADLESSIARGDPQCCFRVRRTAISGSA